MNHIHFLTDLELTSEEKSRALKGHILRTAAANCRDGERKLPMEMVRIENMMKDHNIFHLIPVNDEAVMERRMFSSAIAGKRRA
ncbi:hypothetical protein OVA24_14240 [Luteolibacter sp. SL250]|uniref:hypothetical protein n=1 Tax=Luteolibacter sp. SL250 TaxID=2995170 RepID=UPI0022710027|nr:hypothetical protein [Luteolibacter sp. SL250]WAC18392.1 hypothetical protein OVA24_14240 [Luteolibacter sp. SL250]